MKKLFFCAAIVAAAAFGVIKATEVNNNITDLQFENVEAFGQVDDWFVVWLLSGGPFSSSSSSSSSMCSTGCKANGAGCFCYQWWDDLLVP